MSNAIVIQQMIIIFILIGIGMAVFKNGKLTRESSKDLSWIVVNITNPITILLAAIEDEEKVGAGTLGVAFLAFLLVYALLGVIGYVLPILLGVEKKERYSYRYMSVFANVIFIGLPFCTAVLGKSSLIYVSICALVFNILAYTVGIAGMQKIGVSQHPERENSGKAFSFKSVINAGVVFSLLTLVVYILDPTIPEFVRSIFTHIGRSTTYLSMLVLGVSVAQVPIKKIFGNWRLYAFALIRQIAVPIALYFVLKPFIGGNELMLKTIIILIAMPCANIPLMMANQYDVDDSTISGGIILTTILSIITIPVVTMIF